tara:strand:+ start:625 stop:762 length:138 start_codon:yes stop_codon:yes gene_type:complete
MLFEFNNFWKSVLLLIGTWMVFGLWGYEFTTITLLALLLGTQIIK